jgi:hypothetical protein
MKYSISTLIAVALSSAVIFPVAASAQTTGSSQTSLNPYVAHPTSINSVDPFSLAYLAYQGYLKDQGIPSSGALINAIASGTITAQDIMQAAVKANQLPEQTLMDQGYRSGLESELRGLAED